MKTRFEKEQELVTIMDRLREEMRNAVTRCEREQAKADLKYFRKELETLQKGELAAIPA